MKILEYKPNLGSFSLGFETFDQNEVVEVVNLPKIAEYPYNRTHKQWFLSNLETIEHYKPKNSYDLAIFNPNIGEKIGRKGKLNFRITDICDCLRFLKREMPKFAIFTLDINVVPLLNVADDYIRDGFGQVSKDLLITELKNLGYEAYLVSLDEASYGIPMHRDVALYIATPKDFNMTFPVGLFKRFGSKRYAKYRTIADAISDLGVLGEWVPYKTAPQNVYQRNIRRGMDKTTWNFIAKNPTKDQRATINKIMQGARAASTPGVKKKSGYIRPKWNQICPPLDDRFYLVSSSNASIHPIENRPFTIREGMRLSGLPDNMSFDLKSPKKEIASLVSKAIAPAIGEVTAIALRSI